MSCKKCLCKEVCTLYNSLKGVTCCSNFKDIDNVKDLPCKLGDTVYVIDTCYHVLVDYDMSTGTAECPFEDTCDFDDCDNNVVKIFESKVESIYNDGNKWCVYLKYLDGYYTLDDFDEIIFLSREKAEKKLKSQTKSKGV